MRFAALATAPDARVEDLALAIAAELRGDVDRDAALAALDVLAADVLDAVAGRTDPEAQLEALAGTLHDRHGLIGDTDAYDDPQNSFLDLVLERRLGLPITLSVVYVAVAHRAGIPLAGFGLPGHFVAGHVGVAPPLLIDPFAGGTRVPTPTGSRPWTAHATAMRILNNLVGSYRRRGDVGGAIRAAELRLALPAEGGERQALEVEARALRARLN